MMLPLKNLLSPLVALLLALALPAQTTSQHGPFSPTTSGPKTKENVEVTGPGNLYLSGVKLNGTALSEGTGSDGKPGTGQYTWTWNGDGTLTITFGDLLYKENPNRNNAADEVTLTVTRDTGSGTPTVTNLGFL